ncbi:MAG: hypothetical protein EBS72_02545 [Rhizobiales bacterium]|nr:hypothetical protein [Hyphomicrobiales bacterium]
MQWPVSRPAFRGLHLADRDGTLAAMQNPPPVADQKTEIRRLALARRRQLPDSGRIAASQRIGERVLDLISTEYAANPHIIVAGYWPIRDELDPRLAMQALEQAGFSLALPVIAGQSLRFRRYRTGDLLVAGRFNTFEPAPDCETVTPACVLVPLVAFDGQRAFTTGCWRASVRHLPSPSVWPMNANIWPNCRLTGTINRLTLCSPRAI